MFSLEEIVSAVNGRLIIGSDRRLNEPVTITGVSKDTRTIKEGELYVAIVGENFDGHSFCSQALEKGASLLLVSDVSYLPTTSLAVLVDDTVVALGLLARHYRFKLGAKVIAVTGSVGKTSTREMIAAGLDNSFRVHSTSRNENNAIGLPMTILTAPEDTEVMVLEMGMRLRGEISYLTSIACPDIAIITNIGYSHIERLHSQKEILLSKFEIVEGLVAGGVLAVNGDDKFLTDYSLENVSIANLIASVNVGTTPSPKNFGIFVKAENIEGDYSETHFDVNIGFTHSNIEIKDVCVKASGVHHVRNAMFAFVCAAALNADFEEVKAGIGRFTSLQGRGEVLKSDSITVIDDAYNAAPESMKAALDNFAIIPAEGRKICVLGNMLELGDYASQLHELVGRDAGEGRFDKYYFTGEDSESFKTGLLSSFPDADIKILDSTEAVKEALCADIQPKDSILFKASHSFKYEKLARDIYEEFK